MVPSTVSPIQFSAPSLFPRHFPTSFIGGFRLEDESSCRGRKAFCWGAHVGFWRDISAWDGDLRGWHGKNRGPQTRRRYARLYETRGRRHAARWRGKLAATVAMPWRALANFMGCGHRPRRRRPNPSVTHFPASLIGSFGQDDEPVLANGVGHKRAAFVAPLFLSR